MFTALRNEARKVAERDPRLVPRDRVTAAIEALGATISVLEGTLAAHVQRLDADRIYADTAHATAADCYAAAVGTSRVEGTRRVQTARALRELPQVAEGVRSGAITMRHATVLADAVTIRTQEAMRIDEASFVELAPRVSFGDFTRKVRDWKATHDGTVDDPATRPSTLRLLPGPLGRGTLQGDLTPSDFLECKAVLAPIADRLFRADRAAIEADPAREPRSAGERDAEALMTALLAAANGPDTMFNGAPRATIGIVVTPDELDGHRGGHCAESRAALPAATLDRFSCDAALYRTVMTSGSEVLDLGREVRTASPAQKRALAVRDAGCVVPDCDRPPRWCEAHHVTWHRHGGATTIDNLMLLCRRHHVLVHQGFLSITMHDDQRYEIRTRDGTQLRRSQPAA